MGALLIWGMMGSTSRCPDTIGLTSAVMILRYQKSSIAYIPVLDSASPSKRTSVSSFQSAVDSDSAASINLNMEQDNVNFHIKKQSKYPHVPPHPAEQKGECNKAAQLVALHKL